MPSSSDDFRELLARVQQHDESAARVLVAQLEPELRRIVNSYPTLTEDGDDLMQDILFKVFHKLSSYRGDAPFIHWASRLARFACIDRLRRKKSRPEQRMSDLSEEQRTLLHNIANDTAQPSADVASGLLDRLLATLRPVDAWLLREVELAQRSLTDVAKEAGWNLGLASVRLFRARHRLKRAFDQLEPPTP
ncbi:MAG: RNA polymerase sigma factor [Verrucomicrobiaceae bacterium]|nr:RNA polymerase sigma factor [Verrucomicrobiaceae bacterium]